MTGRAGRPSKGFSKDAFLARRKKVEGSARAAIEALHKALDEPDYDTPRLAWAKLSLLFELAERMDEAENAYKKAAASPEPTGDRFRMVDFRSQGSS